MAGTCTKDFLREGQRNSMVLNPTRRENLFRISNLSFFKMILNLPILKWFKNSWAIKQKVIKVVDGNRRKFVIEKIDKRKSQVRQSYDNKDIQKSQGNTSQKNQKARRCSEAETNRKDTGGASRIEWRAIEKFIFDTYPIREQSLFVSLESLVQSQHTNNNLKGSTSLNVPTNRHL